MIDSFRERWPGCSITVLSDHPSHTNRLHGIQAEHHLPKAPLSWAKRAIDGRLLGTLAAIARCDVFVLGGGGFLSDWQPEAPWVWLRQLLLAKWLRKRTMVYGIGAGPFVRPRGKQLTRKLLNRYADAVSVRDQRSFENLREIGVEQHKLSLTADPAILLHPDVSEANSLKGNDRPRIAVIIGPIFRDQRYWPGQQGKYESFVEQVTTALEELGSEAELTFLPFQLDNDRDFCREIAKASGNHMVVEEEIPPRQMMNVLSGFDLVLSLRLHGCILAAAAGTLPVGIIYHHKGHEFLGRMGLLDYVGMVGDGINWSDQALEGRNLADTCRRALANRANLLESMERNLEAYREAARENIRILTSVLSESPSTRPPSGD